MEQASMRALHAIRVAGTQACHALWDRRENSVTCSASRLPCRRTVTADGRLRRELEFLLGGVRRKTVERVYRNGGLP
jgi:hypothetical protein